MVMNSYFANRSALDESCSEPLSAWAERDLRARFVLDDDLRITWKNAAARLFIDDVDLFIAETGTLNLRGIRQREVFRNFIRSSGAKITSLCLPFSENDHLLCTAINLINGGRPRATGLTLRKASSTMSIGAANLEAAFQLTPSERRVVETLFSGSTAEEIGKGLRLSVGTIRVHIRHIYEKLDVCSREAMFNKLIPFMLVR